jgi:tRNA threonylcarbamoyladenosine biosynthesis protein TsaE
MKSRYDVRLSQATETAQSLAKTLKGGEIFALIGDLGSGKTTFTQALGKALGVTHKILSPTFIVLQELPTKLKTKTGRPVILTHLDLYRTKNFKEIEALGLPETWGRSENITVIEWADKIKKFLPKNTVYVYLTRDVD